MSSLVSAQLPPGWSPGHYRGVTMSGHLGLRGEGLEGLTRGLGVKCVTGSGEEGREVEQRLAKLGAHLLDV